MLSLKSCPRCNGDMLPEEYLGDVDLVCLQCGNRVAAPTLQRHSYVTKPAKKAA
jgi:hypothetical protein